MFKVSGAFGRHGIEVSALLCYSDLGESDDELSFSTACTAILCWSSSS